MRKVMVSVVAGVVGVLGVGCGGGSDLPEADQALADSFWDNLNEFEREQLCEDMSTGSGKATAADEISSELAMDPDSLDAMKSDDTDEALAALGEAGADLEERAVEVVKYLDGLC